MSAFSVFGFCDCGCFGFGLGLGAVSQRSGLGLGLFDVDSSLLTPEWVFYGAWGRLTAVTRQSTCSGVNV